MDIGQRMKKIFNKYLEKRKEKKGFYYNVIAILEGLIFALLIRSFLVHPFYVPSPSMYPNLMQGDYMYVSKYSYGYSTYSFPLGDLLKGEKRYFFDGKFNRGDILVFYNKKQNVYFVKRLIGLPGDTVQIIDSDLYINDKKVEKEFVGYANVEGTIYKDFNNIREFKETLPNGKSYKIWDISEKYYSFDNTVKHTIPKNKLFFLGDNRDSSQDSRFEELGYVDVATVMGKVEHVVVSFKPKMLNGFIRTERFMHEVE